MVDLIDRCAALNIARRATVDTNPDHFEAHQKFIQFMNDPEISSFGSWQWSNGFNVALTSINIDLKHLPSAQKWIPVTERLPEEGEPVLGTFAFQDGNGCLTTERIVIGGKERWSASGGLKPIAWMPLPEPYQAERRT